MKPLDGTFAANAEKWGVVGGNVDALPIIVAMKPLDGTFAANAAKWGVAGLNIDGGRIPTAGEANPSIARRATARRTGNVPTYHGDADARKAMEAAGRICDQRDPEKYAAAHPSEQLGRWPSNLIHDGSPEVMQGFPALHGRGNIAPETHAPGRRGVVTNMLDGCLSEHVVTYPHCHDSGSAARFFKTCEKDERCPLCCLPLCEARDTIVAWKHSLAQTAESNGQTTHATSECIARASAIGRANEKLAQNAKSAGNLCDSCATSIAVALVGIKTSAFSDEELQAILACTRKSERCILIRNLVSFVELWGSTDTTPTTRSLSILFGSVRHAIEKCTRQASGERAGADSGRGTATRFLYSAKASRAERNRGLPEGKRNQHPTVKPLALMEYLCKLTATPTGGIVFDPFVGSGTTGVAAVRLGFPFIGIEQDKKFATIARLKIAAELNGGGVAWNKPRLPKPPPPP